MATRAIRKPSAGVTGRTFDLRRFAMAARDLRRNVRTFPLLLP